MAGEILITLRAHHGELWLASKLGIWGVFFFQQSFCTGANSRFDKKNDRYLLHLNEIDSRNSYHGMLLSYPAC
jgi:hypothetical protein